MSAGDVTRMRRATLIDLADLKAHGLDVRQLDCGFGPVPGSWTLRDLTEPDVYGAEGAALMIGDHGCVSPTQWEAVAEGLKRIAQGDYPPIGSTPARPSAPYVDIGDWVRGIDHVGRRPMVGTVTRVIGAGLYVRREPDGLILYLDASDGWTIEPAGACA